MPPRITKIKRNTYDPETDFDYNTYNEITNVFTEGFMANMFSQDILKDVTSEQIQNYLCNPDNYIKELSNLAMYYYISNGEVFQLFDLAKVLPTLNYKIEVIDKTKNYEKNLEKCNKILNKVGHKKLTRDLISQLISVGTLTAIWIGDVKKPYLYVFDNLDYFYPRYRMFGKWVVSVDLTYLNTLTDFQKQVFFKNLSPYVTEQDYIKFQTLGESYKYVDLPQERSVCLRTHTLKFSQAFGLNWSTTGLYDIKHKKKLKDLEKAIANKIISAIAVLTIGNKADPEKFGNLKLNPELKKKIFANVKKALEKNESQGVTVVGVPEFVDLKFPDMKSDALEPNKFDSINSDITYAYGTSASLSNGSGSNFSSAKINLDMLYKKIGVILEDIESEVYSKLFNIILPSSLSDEYIMIYDKETPITQKEKIEFLFKLHAEGFAIKPIVDSLSGISYDEYIAESIYELEVLKLSERIKPYQSTYTTSNDNKTGKPNIENPDNENTIISKTNDGNSLPE